VGTSDDDDVASGISEGDVKAFARKSFGKIASPYLSPYIHQWAFSMRSMVYVKLATDFYG